MRRVVITGMGLVNASGSGIERTWDDVLNQRVRIAPFRRWQPYEGCPIRAGSEVLEDLEPYLPPKSFRETDRSIHLAAAALAQCIEDSGITEDMREHSGLIYGTTLGQPGLIEEISSQMAAGNAVEHLPVGMIHGISAVAGLVHLTVTFRIRGISYLVQQASASGAASIGEAFDKIRAGRSDLIFAGAADHSLTRLNMAFYLKRRCIPKGYHDRPPEELVIPFCKPELSDRIGVGEAGAVMLLEELEHARRRGAKVYAEICGTGTYQFNENLTGRDDAGVGMTQAIAQLPRERPVGDTIMTVMGIQFADQSEYNLLSRVLDQIRSFTPEPLYGHSTSPTGIMNVMLGVRILQTGIFPGTKNVQEAHLDTPANVIVPSEPLNRRYERVLITVRGYGGYNCAVLLGRC